MASRMRSATSRAVSSSVCANNTTNSCGICTPEIADQSCEARVGPPVRLHRQRARVSPAPPRLALLRSKQQKLSRRVLSSGLPEKRGARSDEHLAIHYRDREAGWSGAARPSKAPLDNQRHLPGNDLEDSLVLVSERVSLDRVQCQHTNKVLVKANRSAETAEPRFQRSSCFAEIQYWIGIHDCLFIRRYPTG